MVMAKCYMNKLNQDEYILHYRRSPSFRSLIVFIGEHMIVLNFAKFKLCKILKLLKQDYNNYIIGGILIAVCNPLQYFIF